MEDLSDNRARMKQIKTIALNMREALLGKDINGVWILNFLTLSQPLPSSLCQCCALAGKGEDYLLEPESTTFGLCACPLLFLLDFYPHEP